MGVDEVEHLEHLLETGEIVLSISYLSGFFLSGLNALIFMLACALYNKVGNININILTTQQKHIKAKHPDY